MLNKDKFYKAHESRHTQTTGVTLVAFFNDYKPKSLSDLTRQVADGLLKKLKKYPELVCPYKTWLHATICGLEGFKDNQGEIVTENMKKRAKITGEQILPFAIDRFLGFIREYRWPLRFRFGGCQPDDDNPYDKERKPWGRTFEVREDGLAVLMGWPLKQNGQPFSADLDNLRTKLREFGVVHKYHLQDKAVDNDLFIVTAALNYKVWEKLTTNDFNDICRRLEEYQEEVRKTLEKEPIVIDLTAESIWIVKYKRTTLEDVCFAERVTKVKTDVVRQLYL